MRGDPLSTLSRMSDAPARLSITVNNPASVVLAGEIDAHTASQLAAQFETLPDDSEAVEINMAGVDFMDSSGLRVVIELHNRISAAGGTLTICDPSRSVSRLLEISGLTDHLNVRSS